MYLGIDLGTSSVKCILLDADQQVVASSTAEFDAMRPKDGWVEQDPQAWIDGIETTLSDLHASHTDALGSVRGIGLSGHMHGATLLDKQDKVLRPCILWNDTRSHLEAARLDTPQSRDLTGNILFPGFTAPKLSWVAAHEPDIFEKIAKVLLPKDYVRWWLTGDYTSEMSDASGTGWLNVGTRDWSDELLSAGNMQRSQMPDLVEGTASSGILRSLLAAQFGMRNDVIVAGGAGDNAASACGMGTIAPGDAFLSLGTSGVLFAANERFQPKAESAVHAFCHALPNTWHQMGVILAATDSLNWLSKAVGQSPADLTQALSGDATASELLFLPYLGGERTPHNNANARGVFFGLNHNSDSQALTQAVLQGVSFAFLDSLNLLAGTGTRITEAYAIGGGSRSEYWLQMLATVLQIPLHVTQDGDYGAGLGAARLGMMAADGSSPIDVCYKPPIANTIEPNPVNADAFREQYSRFKETYQALYG